MTELIFTFSSDQKKWPHLIHLIQGKNWNKIFAVTEPALVNKLQSSKNIEYIVVDYSLPVSQIIPALTSQLKSKLGGFEIALNLVSGSGKEHMVILSSLLKLGAGIRLTAYTKKGVVEI
tara:strand:+ start:2001 stop:2357 length:357 start_codon:yes stop_codon:yes gene_type:complete